MKILAADSYRAPASAHDAQRLILAHPFMQRHRLPHGHEPFRWKSAQGLVQLLDDVEPIEAEITTIFDPLIVISVAMAIMDVGQLPAAATVTQAQTLLQRARELVADLERWNAFVREHDAVAMEAYFRNIDEMS